MTSDSVAGDTSVRETRILCSHVEQGKLVHEVEYGCCGARARILAATFRDNQRRGRRMCLSCAAKAAGTRRSARIRAAAEAREARPDPALFSRRPLADWQIERQLDLVFPWARRARG